MWLLEGGGQLMVSSIWKKKNISFGKRKFLNTFCYSKKYIFQTKNVDIGFAAKVPIVLLHLSDLVELHSIWWFLFVFQDLKSAILGLNFFGHYFEKWIWKKLPNHLSFWSLYIFLTIDCYMVVVKSVTSAWRVGTLYW